MPASLNTYFNFFMATNEQSLVESLVSEALAMYAHAVYYIPRVIENKDKIYETDTISQYNTAILTGVYIRSFNSYEGDGQFLSKFNIEIRDSMKFEMSRKFFADEIATITSQIRPNEGDLIYSPMMKRLFVIKYVNNTNVFYQLGSLQTYGLSCEVVEYSNEIINTGISEIDEIAASNSIDMSNFDIFTNDGFVLVDSYGFDIVQSSYDLETQSKNVFAENTEIKKEATNTIDFSEVNPFGVQ